ncbi:tyrosine-type recombinase/integrase [Candidatus Neomarinimicrobiota bacterium]
MSCIYKRKDSRYYWWTTHYKGKKIRKSTKMTHRALAMKIRTIWDYKLMIGDIDFLGRSNRTIMDNHRFILEYLKFVERRKSENTLAITKGVLYKFQEFLDNRNINYLSDIKIKTIDDFIDWLQVSPKTKKNYVSIIRLMFEKAIKDEMTNTNPAKYATLPKIISGMRHRPLGPIDIKIIFDGAGKWYLYYSFLYYTGLRAGDVAILKYGNIDLDRKAIIGLVRKSRRIHKFPLADRLIDQIPNSKYGDAPIFPGLFTDNGRELNGKLAMPRKHLQSLLTTNGRPKADLHSFRVTYNNNLRDQGIPIQDRQILLAHSSSETTKIYTHPNFELAKRYVNLIPNIS